MAMHGQCAQHPPGFRSRCSVHSRSPVHLRGLSSLHSTRRTVISVNNLPEEWATEAKLRSAMEHFGAVLRCVIVTNPKGESKQLGIVDFALPTAAAKAVQAVLLCYQVHVLLLFSQSIVLRRLCRAFCMCPGHRGRTKIT